ncbi:MAG: LEA type 2 family protein [Xanthomonadaceae bacterium]|nr:LEA type 2 family protein [Xanthomonadaceae bacterium]
MFVRQKATIIIAVSALVAGCASLPFYEQPQVTVTTVALSPKTSNFAAPRFDIGLRVVNPNRVALPLRGIDYSLDIGGSRLVSGATRDLPRIPANGAADFTIEVSPDFASAARVFNELMTRRDVVQYTFRARLDVGGLVPNFNVEQRGQLTVTGN